MAEHDDYPVDEFDNLESAAKKGAHRKPAGPLSQGAAIALVTVLAVVAIILVGGTINIIQRSSANPERQDDTTQVEASPEPGGSAGATQSGGASATAEASVNRSDYGVHVLNASGKTGAAASLKTKLEDKGWNVTDTANASSSSKETIVFYATKSAKAAAQALAKDVGADPDSVKRSSQYNVDLAVVLCSDLA